MRLEIYFYPLYQILIRKNGGEGGIDHNSLRAVLTPAGRLWRLNSPVGRVCRTGGLNQALNLPLKPIRAAPWGPPFLIYGGEGGIRTLDTFPYTHFPGVRLRPLGHLTVEGAHHSISRGGFQSLKG